MSSPRWLPPVILLALLCGAVFALGYGTARARDAEQRRAIERTADSLRVALRTRVAWVVRDTLRVDSIVTRWRRVTDTVQRTDTLTVERVVRLADSTIAAVDSARRMCTSVLLDCERTALALTDRATRAEARVVSLEGALGRRPRWRAFADGVCVTSLATNYLQWRAR